MVNVVSCCRGRRRLTVLGQYGDLGMELRRRVVLLLADAETVVAQFHSIAASAGRRVKRMRWQRWRGIGRRHSVLQQRHGMVMWVVVVVVVVHVPLSGHVGRICGIGGHSGPLQGGSCAAGSSSGSHGSSGWKTGEKRLLGVGVMDAAVPGQVPVWRGDEPGRPEPVLEKRLAVQNGESSGAGVRVSREQRNVRVGTVMMRMVVMVVGQARFLLEDFLALLGLSANDAVNRTHGRHVALVAYAILKEPVPNLPGKYAGILLLVVFDHGHHFRSSDFGLASPNDPRLD